MFSRFTASGVQVAKGLGYGLGGAMLYGGNASGAVYAGRCIDPNNKPEAELEKHDMDVFCAAASAVTTRKILGVSAMPLATRVGASVPMAVCAGVAASWVYQKSGPVMTALLEKISK